MSKLYSRKRFAAELILELETHPFSIENISKWSDNIRSKYIGELDSEIEDITQDLSAMTFGDEFEMSKEEIERIAIKLLTTS